MLEQLVLIRHGATKFNKAHAYCGATDQGLCSEGIAELKTLMQENTYPDINTYSLVTSDKKRTVQTAGILFPEQAPSVIIEKDFSEMNFGIFECMTYMQLKDNPEYQKWISSDNQANVCPGGESGIELERRVLSALQKYSLRFQRLAIVTHGGPIAIIMQHSFSDENKNRWEWQGNCGTGYHIDFSGGKASYTVIPKSRSL